MTRHYLLVDDNPDFADNMKEILSATGAEVDVASCAEEGLELARRCRYDAIVTDMRMPGMSGAELLAKVRSIDPGVPAVLLTAFSRTELLRLARRDGLLAVLSKPDHVSELLEVLPRARRDGAVVVIEEDFPLTPDLSARLTRRGLTCVPVGSIDELNEVSTRPFVVLVDAAHHADALAKVEARWPGVPTVSPPPHDADAMTERIEGYYREHRA
jgi:CheY-like chemotaxis protein